MIKICISVTSHALDPLPSVTNCHTFSDPLPLERDVLYGRPLSHLCISHIPLYFHKIYTFSPYFRKIWLNLRFLLPLFWPWCIYHALHVLDTPDLWLYSSGQCLLSCIDWCPELSVRKSFLSHSIPSRPSPSSGIYNEFDSVWMFKMAHLGLLST